jgi:hypothetical protein
MVSAREYLKLAAECVRLARAAPSHEDNVPGVRTGRAGSEGPIDKAENYRVQALLATKMAASSRSPEHKAQILRIAEQWLELAAQAEVISGVQPIAPPEAPPAQAASGG